MIVLPQKYAFSQKIKHLQSCICKFDPGSFLRFLVLLICFVVMFIQLQECWNKLRNPPIITYTKLTLNETIAYPALTICREPPFNKRYYKKYNFTGLHIGSYPVTSNWKYFPYDQYNISDFWTDAIYNDSYIICHGLNGLDTNFVDLQSSLHLTTGMCHTIRPKSEVPAVGKNPGYHILLLHDLYEYDRFTDKEAGWYIYVHEVKEKFSGQEEVEVFNLELENINIYSGRQAWVFVPVGEKVEVSLDVYQFKSIQNCSDDPSYSLAECEENCWIQEDISPKTNCSGPWLPKLDKPLCNEPNGMIDLVKATERMCPTQCCPKSCRSMQYKTSVVKRTPYPKLRRMSSGAWIYFGSKAVMTVEERYSYDWNAFISDLGGSIGFLLGLSVIGIIAYLERIIQFFIPYFTRNKKA